MTKLMPENELFDFGFTAMDETELDVVQNANTEKEAVVEAANIAEEKVNKLYNAILPLLNNLKQNPEKDYIYWPNRIGKVEAFEDMISKIIED